MTTETSDVSRASLHELVDKIPDDALAAARERLVALFDDDPALRAALLAPPDDEPFTDQERQAVEVARAAYRRGEWVSGEDVRREIGW
jgi:hypothetical protein